MKNTITLFLIFCFPFVLFAQTSKIYNNRSMTRKILKGERKYAIYLPPGYEISECCYPVLYLLHGSGDDQTGWVQYIADKAIQEIKATPMIIVMPDADPGRNGILTMLKVTDVFQKYFLHLSFQNLNN